MKTPPDQGSKRKGGLRNRFSPSDVLWVWSGAAWIWGRIRDDGSPARTLHRDFQRYTRAQHGLLGEWLRLAGFVAGVPVLLGMILVLTARHGARVREQDGKERFRQIGEQLTLWLTQGVLPVSYYVFELHRENARFRALEYLYRYETKRGIYAILRDTFSSAETTEALRSKAGFALRCRAHGVAAVAALFAIEDERITRFDSDEPGLPHCDLFLKPLSGSGGRDASIWRYQADGTYRNDSDEVMSGSDFVGHLRKLAQEEPFVGREYVRNHPETADLSPLALSSIRVVTCLDENDRPEVTHAVLRMARTPGVVVDNFHAGGIAASVDLDTGTLGAATDLGLNRATNWWEKHPLTGGQILGRQIPMWSKVVDLAQRAHELFADQIVVGWDIAVLEGGPSLIEGNKSPDLDIVQRTRRAPIGNSRLGVLLAHHFRRALQQQAERESLP